MLSVTETDPLVGDYPSNGHVSEKEANKENIAAPPTLSGLFLDSCFRFR